MILSTRDNWAYDIAKNINTKGEVWDDVAIKQSIETILTTSYGERVFNPFFGSPLYSFISETISQQTAERLLDSIIKAIKRWEDRITILENSVKMIISYDSHAITLKIPYIIKKLNIVSSYDKKIIF